jgi:hypothetical protein
MKDHLPTHYLSLILAICTFLLPSSGFGESRVIPGQASSNPGLYLEPSKSYIQPGERCTLSVMVDDGADSLSCAMCVLSFDPGVVSCVEAGEGELYLNSSYSTFFNWERFSPDSVRVEDCVLGYRSFILAPGELYTVVFEALQPGTTAVRLEEAEVYDIDRVQLPVDLGPGASISVSITADDGGGLTPPAFFECYPNPFNPSTTLTFRSPPGKVSGRGGRGMLRIYSPEGKLVKTVFRGNLREGINEFRWYGEDEQGRSVSSGVYMAVLRTPSTIYKQKVILVK